MDETLDVAYAQNLISSINVVLEAMRGPLPIRIASPSDWVGRRVTYRSEPQPAKIEPSRCCWRTACYQQGMPRAGCCIALPLLRRAPEGTVLANISDWIKQALGRGDGRREGTKGGRGNEIERWVPCDKGRQYLLAEANASPERGVRRKAMLLPDETRVRSFVNNGEINRARLPLHKLGIKGVHGLRAAYACQRYEDLMAIWRPCFCRTIARDIASTGKLIDTITMELGLERRDVIEEYIGDYSAHRSLLQNRKYEASKALKAAKK
ncbi:MAG: hypothetical protein IPG13_03365 [Rhodocyclaceae bacterium]|nr:hypothetical protein [Rhodocyclaceae bacterium]